MADSLLDDRHANVVAINYTLIYVFWDYNGFEVVVSWGFYFGESYPG